MRIYRFAVHPAEDGIYHLKCINDPKLFTQAKSMDEAVVMARDVAQAMFGETGVLIELVIPPDVTTPAKARPPAARKRTSKTAASRRPTQRLVA